MLRKCWREFSENGCGHCCGECNHGTPDRFQNVSPLIGGFLYGLTPCAPLIILAGYAVSMPILKALVIGVVFSMSCTISPLFLMLVLMKLVAVKMRSEVPAFFNMMKITLSAVVLIIGCMTIFTGMEFIV